MNDNSPQSTDNEITAAESGHQVTLPPPLTAQIHARLAHTEFDSVESYVGFVLESVLRELDDGQDGQQTQDAVPGNSDTDDSDTDNRDRMEDRLESLGYL